MDSARRAPATSHAAEALEFVRFCYQRRRIGWPELYDEMCAVAGRGLFRGWGSDDLATVGIGFSLSEMPGLAVLAAQVVGEETAGERSGAAARGRPASAGRVGANRPAGHEELPAETRPESEPAGGILLAPGAA